MIYPGDAYRDFKQWCKSFKSEIEKNISPHDYFAKEHTISRSFQIFTETSSDDYSLAYRKKRTYSFTKFGPFIIKNGSIKIALKSRLIFNGLFIIECGLLFFQILSGLFRKRKKIKTNYNILIEPPINGSTKNLENFLIATKIKGLNKIDQLIIKKRFLPSDNRSDLVFCKNPWVYILHSNFSFFQRISIGIKFLLFSLNSFFYLNKMPLNILFYRDLPNSFLVRILNKKKMIKHIYITNSSFQVQPLWYNGLKSINFKSHMIWYSQNFIPKFYKGESEQSYLPGSSLMRVDHHWVWTMKFGEMLKKLNPNTNYSAINPIMFYPVQNPDTNSKTSVVIFDVIPIKNKNRVIFGATYNYYSLDIIKKFVRDILKTVEKINQNKKIKLEVILKTKRPKHINHSEEYFSFLKEQTRHYSYFKIVDSQMNVYKLIKEALITFSVPYTSTAEVGYELKTPSFFYDPSNTLIPNDETSHINLLFNKTELEQSILDSIEQKNQMI